MAAHNFQAKRKRNVDIFLNFRHKSILKYKWKLDVKYQPNALTGWNKRSERWLIWNKLKLCLLRHYLFSLFTRQVLKIIKKHLLSYAHQRYGKLGKSLHSRFKLVCIEASQNLPGLDVYIQLQIYLLYLTNAFSKEQTCLVSGYL